MRSMSRLINIMERQPPAANMRERWYQTISNRINQMNKPFKHLCKVNRVSSRGCWTAEDRLKQNKVQNKQQIVPSMEPSSKRMWIWSTSNIPTRIFVLSCTLQRMRIWWEYRAWTWAKDKRRSQINNRAMWITQRCQILNKQPIMNKSKATWKVTSAQSQE